MTENSKAYEGIALIDLGSGRDYADGFYGGTVAGVIEQLTEDEETLSMVVVESATNEVVASWIRGVGWYVLAEVAGAQGAGFVS